MIARLKTLCVAAAGLALCTASLTFAQDAKKTGGAATTKSPIEPKHQKASSDDAVIQYINELIRKGWEDAGLKPADIGHINAHGSGDPEEDAIEAAAIHDVFGEFASTIPVCSIKGYIGNSGAGSGIVEIAASLLAASEGKAPKTLNCDQPDPALKLNVTRDFIPVANKTFVKINYTRAGQATAVVFEGA